MQGPGSREDPDQHPVQEPSRAALDPTIPLLPSDSKEPRHHWLTKATCSWSSSPGSDTINQTSEPLWLRGKREGMDPLSWSQKTNPPVPHPHCSQNSPTLGQRLDGHTDPPGHTGATLQPDSQCHGEQGPGQATGPLNGLAHANQTLMAWWPPHGPAQAPLLWF
ncbi:unnamed protein product [Rangifer tarandus platyrhynchus]|uniref:Uncharacterized protein n=1 Tax=Rangifer tarandus platyrhynchus TaxID=3082113 RepID=A0AC60AAH5_RANTA